MDLSNRPSKGLKVKRCMMSSLRTSGFFQGGECREFSTPLHAYPSRLGHGLPDGTYRSRGSFISTGIRGGRARGPGGIAWKPMRNPPRSGPGSSARAGCRTDARAQRGTRSVQMHEGGRGGNVRRKLPATRCFLAPRRSMSRLKDRIELLRLDLLLCASGQCRQYPSVRLRRCKSSLTGGSAGANQRSSDKRQVIDSITWIFIFGRPWTNSTRSSTP